LKDLAHNLSTDQPPGCVLGALLLNNLNVEPDIDGGSKGYIYIPHLRPVARSSSIPWLHLAYLIYLIYPGVPYKP